MILNSLIIAASISLVSIMYLETKHQAVENKQLKVENVKLKSRVISLNNNVSILFREKHNI